MPLEPWCTKSDHEGARGGLAKIRFFRAVSDTHPIALVWAGYLQIDPENAAPPVLKKPGFQFLDFEAKPKHQCEMLGGVEKNKHHSRQH